MADVTPTVDEDKKIDEFLFHLKVCDAAPFAESQEEGFG